MNRPTRALAGGLATLCLLLLLPPGAGAAITYEHESEAAFAGQLNAKQIQSATINKRVRSVRLTLTDGRHVLARYPKHQGPATIAKLKAHGVPVTVLSTAEANKELKAQPKHHKIRYIVGAVVIAVIVIVGGVLLVNRRRRQD